MGFSVLFLLVVKLLRVYLLPFAKPLVRRLDKVTHEHDRPGVVVHADLLVYPMKHLRLQVRQPDRVEAVYLVGQCPEVPAVA